MREFVLLTGSNLADRRESLSRARSALAARSDIRIENSSGLYESAAVGMGAGANDFLNQALLISTTLSPLELLRVTQEIEISLGRDVADKGKLLPRTIDIDILLCGAAIISEVELRIPHRGLTERSFALAPLLEVAPNAVDPISGRRFAEFFSAELQKQVWRVGASEETA